MKVNPDLDFIKYMKSAGGDTLKKCYQCATCSVVCPLSSDTKPFPRKEMIWAQWGLKDKLVADPDVMLCHQCGDCTAFCPRGAKPGDVLGAIRAYAYTHYGFPSGLAKMVSSSKNLPLTIGIPALIVLIMWALSGGMHILSSEDLARYGFGHFFGHWDWRWLTKNVAFIDIIMVPAFFLACYSAYRGVSTMWKDMEKNYNVNAEYRPSVPQFIQQFLVPAVKEILLHKRFNECGTNQESGYRSSAAAAVLYCSFHCHGLQCLYPGRLGNFFPPAAWSDQHVEPGEDAGQRCRHCPDIRGGCSVVEPFCR